MYVYKYIYIPHMPSGYSGDAVAIAMCIHTCPNVYVHTYAYMHSRYTYNCTVHLDIQNMHLEYTLCLLALQPLAEVSTRILPHFSCPNKDAPPAPVWRWITSPSHGVSRNCSGTSFIRNTVRIFAEKRPYQQHTHFMSAADPND